jgi:DNA polymerase-3 subunit gamma/tau
VTAAPTTGWDVAPIPQSAVPEPDEPEYITEEPAGGIPDVVTDPGPPAPLGTVPAPTRRVDPAPDERATAARPTSAAAPVPSRAPQRAGGSVPQNSRYGEAVVREILNAQFMHEETIEPKVAQQPSSGGE